MHTFYQCASDVGLSQMQDSETESTIVVVINLARVTWSEVSKLHLYKFIVVCVCYIIDLTKRLYA